VLSYEFMPASVGSKRQRGGEDQGGHAKAAKQVQMSASPSVMREAAARQLPEWRGNSSAMGGAPGVYQGRVSDGELYVLHAALATEADVAEQLGGASVDVHEDQNVLQYLRHNVLPVNLTVVERRRVRKRSRQYEFNGVAVVRMMADGSRRVVPPVNARVDLIRATHEQCGHWGVRRTASLLLSSHWWQGLERDVAKELATCKTCAQVDTSFEHKSPTLQSLRIDGMFYRWGVDLAGPFVTSARGNVYVMVCIEHFSKHVELIAIPDKSADTTAYAFLSHVIGRFGACAEVLTDQGSEFRGAFQLLLEQCLIDHRTTSASHPQANGLAERCVQSVKIALSKHVLQHGTLRSWDEHLHWIALGYRCSKQQSSGLSPYQMLYGCEPCVPPAIKDRFRPGLALVFDTPEHREQAAEYMLMRGTLQREHCSIAMTNLRSAQQRDSLRYATLRNGLYRHSSLKFSVGQFVHVRRPNVTNTLMSDARPGIYRILEVRASGVLVLQGKCGSTMQVHQQNCAPCWLTNIDGSIDHTLRRPGVDECCVVCDSAGDEAIMLMCDGCGKGYHTYCLQPPLAGIPDAIVWLCPNCERAGVQIEPLLRQREAAADRQPLEAAMFPSVAQRAADAAAAQLDGQGVLLDRELVGGEPQQGVFRFVPREDRPPEYVRRPLKLQSPSGDVWCTLRAAQKLLARGAVAQLTTTLGVVGVGERVRFVAATTVAGGKSKKAPTGRWPEEWDLFTVEGCGEACTALFGAVPAFEHVRLQAAFELAQLGEPHVAEGYTAPAGRACPYISTHAAIMLLNVVDVRTCGRLVCPWGGEMCLESVLLQRYAVQCMSAGADRPLEAMLSPGYYKHIGRQSPVDWVFLYPPVGLQDLALAVAVAAAVVGVAMLVDDSYVTSGPQHRQHMLKQLIDQERVAIVTEQGTSSAWVVVFATAGHLHSMCTRVPRVGAYCDRLPARV
jgi:transposase InsO family protein